MAPGIGRLGSVLRQDIADVLGLLDEQPSPRGNERATAERLRDWAAVRWPEIVWRLDRVGDDGSGVNLVASHPVPGPLLYSHLDTSMEGSARDALVTGRGEPVGPLRWQDDVVDGFSLTVARAPAAAALVAFAHARAGSLLLASSGTHRKHGSPRGIDAYLARNPLPGSAIVAKSGPPGVLWEEPGAAYLVVRVTGGAGAAVLPSTARPEGGVIAQLGTVLAAIDSWRTAHLTASRQRDDLGQMVAECGIGSVAAGWHDKPDLLPGTVDVGLYLVLVTGDDAEALRADLQVSVTRALQGTVLESCDVEVEVEVVDLPAGTSPDAPIVVAAVEAWTARHGHAPSALTWSGSTDGVVLRAAGVDTARVGPTGVPAADDPRRDAFTMTSLVDFAHIYKELLDS